MGKIKNAKKNGRFGFAAALFMVPLIASLLSFRLRCTSATASAAITIANAMQAAKGRFQQLCE